MTDASAATSPLITFGIPVVTFFVGFMVRGFTFSLKERKDFEQANYDNSVALVEKHREVCDAYTAVLTEYGSAETVTFDLFAKVMTAGDRYFDHVRFTCDAIMSGKVDTQIRDSTMLPKIVKIAVKNLRLHYEALQAISKKQGWPYTGELRRSDYQSIFDVVDKFGLPEWAEASQQAN